MPDHPAPPAGLDDLVERFDHVAVAVHDIQGVLPMVELLGGSFRSGGDYQTGGFRWAQFYLPGDVKLELIQPLSPDDKAHFLVRFLRQHGEGLHHLTFKVTDIHAAISRARSLGFDVVRENTSSDAWKEAFVHPGSSHGVLIQLAEWSDWPDAEDFTVEDVIAGRRII